MSKGPGLFGIGRVAEPPRSTIYTTLLNVTLTIIWIVSIYVVIVLNNYYNDYKNKKGNGTSKAETSLKLEAQKVTPFSRNFADWARWRSCTQCTFDGSGYEKNLNDEKYALDNPCLKKLVFLN